MQWIINTQQLQYSTLKKKKWKEQTEESKENKKFYEINIENKNVLAFYNRSHHVFSYLIINY